MPYRSLEDIRFVGGSAHPALAQAVAKELGVTPCHSTVTRFKDGEIQVVVEENIRGCDVVILQPTCAPVAEMFMELAIMADAFRRSSARSITAVVPYFGYARQDKKVKPREPITARLAADFLQVAGVTRMVVVDPHSEQLQGFFSIPFDNLYAGPLFVEFFEQRVAEIGARPEDICIVSPDVTGTPRAQYLSKALDCDFAVITKRRPRPNVVEAGRIVGDVEGKWCIIIDDMMDTCGTLAAASGQLERAGASRISIACSHPVLSGDALAKLTLPLITEIVCLDTIPISDEKREMLGDQQDKLFVLPSAPMIAKAVELHQTGGSVSSLFKDWRR